MELLHEEYIWKGRSGEAVASGTRDPQFEASHRQLQTRKQRKRAREMG